MSHYEVLKRGDDEILSTRPAASLLWNCASLLTSMGMIAISKLVLATLYNKEVKGLENFEEARRRSKEENRGLITLMNHMSTCDDPMIFACLPWKFSREWNDIRWGLAAANVCFTNKLATNFFSLGKIIPCERFGRGPFQSGLDACVRILSPDDTITESLVKAPESAEPLALFSPQYSPPMLRNGPSWVHVFPEGYVCQLQPPFGNSMRFFRWGTARLILEPTVAPIVVPLFATGFELIKPEEIDLKNDYLTPNNVGATVRVNIGPALDDGVIAAFRKEWQALCERYPGQGDLSHEAKFGAEAKDLRIRVCAYLRESVVNLREGVGLGPEDPRFKSVDFWTDYTKSRGTSDPEVKFIGINWAIKEYQRDVSLYDEFGNVIGALPSERPPNL